MTNPDATPTVDDKEREEQVLRGHIESIFDDYPGFIQFPHPLMLHHIWDWWSMLVEKNKTLEKDSLEYQQNEWFAYKHLLIEYDGWHIEGIPIGDVKADRIPGMLVSFICTLGQQYVWNHLTPKQQGVLRTII